MIYSMSLHPPQKEILVEKQEPIKTVILKVQSMLLKLSSNYTAEAAAMTHVEMILIKKEVAKSSEESGPLFLQVMEKILSLLEKPSENLPNSLQQITENLPIFRKNMLAEKQLPSLIKEKETYLEVIERRKLLQTFMGFPSANNELLDLERLNRNIEIVTKKINSLKCANEVMYETQQKCLEVLTQST